MRTFRLFLSLLTSLFFVTFLLFVSLSSDQDEHDDHDRPNGSRRGLGSLFYFRNPASLFTPAATISLTDDNSTAFAAWPAAFGPLLPLNGLSGELWIGSGFGDDNLKRRGIAAGLEGELGCSDIPGWADHDWWPKPTVHSSVMSSEKSSRNVKDASTKTHPRAVLGKRDSSEQTDSKSSKQHPAERDGTDDHLQFPLPSTNIIRRSEFQQNKGKNGLLQHADIQSLQESAEIAGKIVILSRGGCGFSEKVKWAQRRGATAVIVGDNVLGGPLVRMYARGDTSNITIPSLFTSHTTAHLLSSLIPIRLQGTDASSSATLWKFPSNSPLDPFRVGQDTNSAQRNGNAKPLTSTTIVPSKAKPTSQVHAPKSDKERKTILVDVPKTSWIKSSLSAVGLRHDNTLGGIGEDSRRPPSSGQLLWPHVEHQNGEAWKSKLMASTNQPNPSKGFVIGVQDWRDPDVVRVHDSVSPGSRSTAPSIVSKPTAGSHGLLNPLKGGSITPGSGEYEQPKEAQKNVQTPSLDLQGNEESGEAEDHNEVVDAEGWLTLLAWSANDETSSRDLDGTGYVSPNMGADHRDSNDKQMIHQANAHSQAESTHRREGLWVTLTPTDMDSNPFFNTLFVLVVSPLITLGIVYSMLLLRSRIRRRRWRAPKSLVERLPVHVYHTTSLTDTSSSSEPAFPLPSTVTTPLLAESRPGELAVRPRSRTVPGSTVPGPMVAIPSSSRYGSLEPSSAEQEKVNSALAEWRRKYRGKQVECVVCLEEYVDGVSKVMSLPCGHEFHVDCITPWLTTRRRTCPICKGDVVRSMSRTANTPNIQAANNMTEEDVQEQAAETTNDSPSSNLPIPLENNGANLDLERGDEDQVAAEGSASSSWSRMSRNVSRGLGYLGVQQHAEHDR